MERPHIICHMETSITGKAYGPFMEVPLRAALARAYDETHLSFGSQAWLCGRVTMAYFAGTGSPRYDPKAPRVARQDYIGDAGARDFVVSGGPIVNGSFLHAGLIDEISLVTVPALDDANDTPTSFQRPVNLSSQSPRTYTLKSAQVLSDDVLWVRYVTP